MHAHRVDVLDRADDHAVVVAVAHDLQLELLPAGDRLLDQDLADRGDLQAPPREVPELLARVREPAAAAAERERRPDDHRVADRVAERQRLVEGVRDLRPRHLEPGLEHRPLEPAAVLGAMDRLQARADQADAQAVQVAGLGQRHGDVQAGLTAERRQQRVRPLALEHGEHGCGVERFDVGPVGELRVGHDRGGVGVHQRHLEPLAPEHLARLGARVVELARLPDHDRPRADHHDRSDVGAPRHQPCSMRSRKSWNR